METITASTAKDQKIYLLISLRRPPFSGLHELVETPEQYYAVFSFTDDANVAFLVKREDGKVEEIKGMLYRAHYDVVGGGRKTKEKKTTL